MRRLFFCVENTEILFKGNTLKTLENQGLLKRFATVVVTK